ncbi:hypothetical protein GALMADRAFT_134766 [Galerina marginata CBS 339.88]|uniref:Uncharacterized protein n=1 Tax=Galerina marginata (strain CBS 339.88) TaxID=685588 RepID=A0A067TLR9_GALM3|nr:hypothetical protein GALMADRAFT_134766 [Galerina marginata CBS 339.88]
MLSCPLCSYTHLDNQKSTLASHKSSLHRDRYWVLGKETGKLLFAIRRETPTSSLQCPSCTYATPDSRCLWTHLQHRHLLEDFTTTTQLKRVPANLLPTNGAELDRKDEVKEVISIFDSDDESDIVFIKPQKAQPISAGRAMTATGSSRQKCNSSTSNAVARPRSQAEGSTTCNDRDSGSAKSSRPHQKPSQGTVAKRGSSSQKRPPDADIPVALSVKRRLIQTFASEQPPNTEMSFRELSVRKSKTEAMDRVQRLETGLSDRCVVALIDLFQEDVSAADAYLALTREGVRKQWIADRVRHIRDCKDEVL